MLLPQLLYCFGSMALPRGRCTVLPFLFVYQYVEVPRRCPMFVCLVRMFSGDFFFFSCAVVHAGVGWLPFSARRGALQGLRRNATEGAGLDTRTRELFETGTHPLVEHACTHGDIAATPVEYVMHMTVPLVEHKMHTTVPPVSEKNN